MTYDSFRDDIVSLVSQKLPDSVSLSVRQIVKNNGVTQDCLTIKDPSVNLAPAIYLSDYYDYSIKNGIDKTVDILLDTYENQKVSTSFNIDFFNDFNQVKSRILFKVINKSLNTELLQDIPSIDYLDLSIVFYYYFDKENAFRPDNMSIQITNKIISNWDVTVKQLMECAIENTPRILGLEVNNIVDVLKDSLDEKMISSLENQASLFPMMVCTNKNRTYGAGVFIYKDMLKALAARVKSNLFIIPSSIHEVIVIPETLDDELFDPYALKNMVEYVNSNSVEKKDILSNNVYFYSKSDGLLTVY